MMKRLPLLLLSLLLVSCHYHDRDTTLYAVGDNFLVAVDSLPLQSERPLHTMPVDTLSERLCVYMDDPLVVAEMLVIPEDSVDSVWVKLAHDQYTMGWTHQRDFLESIVPDDPISQFIHLFSTRHPWLFAMLIVLSLPVLLWQILSRRKPHVFFLRDILSPYPTLLLIVLAASALLYAGIQHYVPETWMLYYYHPTLNPFGLPPVLCIFLCSVWVLFVLLITTADEAFRLLPTAEAALYLLSLAGCCIACYLTFTLAAVSPLVCLILFAAFAIVLIVRYIRHSRVRFLCGSCGGRLHNLGKCPHCGAENK